MKAQIASLLIAALAVIMPTASQGNVINPTSDGSLYVCGGCTVVNDGAYVLTSGYIQGEIKFSTASIAGLITKVLLTINPYGLPLGAKEVAIYGYGTSIGQLDESDANAGTFLGTLVLPDTLGFGQDAFFDVTSFVSLTHSPYLAFNLRTTGTDVFSSLEYNYGHPSQLLVSAVAEPSDAALLLAAFACLLVASNRRFASRGAQRKTAIQHIA